MSPQKPLLQRIKSLFPRVLPSVPDARSRTGTAPPAARVKAGYTYFPGTAIPLDEFSAPLPDPAHTTPITAAGIAIGEIQAGAKETVCTGREIELIDAVARSLGKHLENLSRKE
ncbi:MAG: hypothetical protein JW929_01250 [Anaerolineales bacterium]|nr:hypothetical protein [Anaerolineales bacterium]